MNICQGYLCFDDLQVTTGVHKQQGLKLMHYIQMSSSVPLMNEKKNVSILLD